MITLGCNQSLPEDWQWVKARECLDVRDGTHDSPKYVSEGFPLVTSKNLVDGKIDFSTCNFISEEDHYAISKRSSVDEGDILYAMIGTIGNPVVVNKDCEFSIKNVALFKFNNENLFNRYFYHFLNSPLAKNQFDANARGGTQKFVSLGNIRELEIPLPPLSEQKRIAAILDKADAIRRKRQQAIQLADDFLRAVFLDMFGDPETNPKNWSVRSVYECLEKGEILEIQDGNHGNDHPKVSDFTSNGHPFITANVVRNGNILFDKCYYLSDEWLNKLRIGFAKPGDVLLSHKGSLGFTAVLDESFETYIFSPQTTYYRVNREVVDPEYLKGYFNSAFFQRILAKSGIQSTRAYVGITRQKELPIMIPPIDIQRKYVTLIKKIRLLTNKVLISHDNSHNLFDSLSQKAFSGQL